MKKLLLFFCLIFFSHQAFADLIVTVDRKTLPEGESFQLFLRQNGDAVQPDISVLDQDFLIVGQRKSYKTSIINGKAEKYNENILTLIPKKTGEVILPAIYAGKEHTSPLALTVVPAGKPLPPPTGQPAAKPVQARVFLRADAAEEKPYLAQQVPYTVKLYSSADTVLLDGAITPPQAEGVTVEQWGDPKRSQTLLNDIPYNVLEYRFLLFPQKSGRITLTAPQFRGLVSDPDAQQDTMQDMFGFQGVFTGFFGQKNIAVQASEVTLDVLPKPAVAGSNLTWIPALDVEIAEEVSPAVPTIALGEAVTRTVTVVANGVRDTQIPDPIFASGADYKQYPGQTDSKNLFDGNGIVGIKTRQVVFMPTKPGEIVLPGLEIPWFDVQTKTMKKAVLPDKAITVTGSGAAEPEPAAPPASAMPAVQQPVPAVPTGVREEVKEIENRIADHSAGRLFAAGALAGAAGATVLALVLNWFVFRKVRRLRSEEERRVLLPRRTAETGLKQACAADDAAGVRRALLQVAEVYWPESPPLTLSAAADRFGDPDLAQQIEILNAVLYASEDRSWSGKDLWDAFKETKIYRKKIGKGDQPPVPSLYPT